MSALLGISLTAVQWWWLGALGVVALVALVIAVLLRRDPYRSSWRVEVERRLVRTEGADEQLRLSVRACLGEDSPGPGDGSFIVGAKTGIGGWWTGRNEDVAHGLIDAFERSTVPDDPAARAVLARWLRVQVRTVLSPADPASIEALQLLAGTPSKRAVERAWMLVHEGWSRLRRSQRARRNRAIEVSLGFVVAGIAVAAMLDEGVGSMSLLRVGSKQAAPIANAYALVALGAVGGLLSLLPMVRRTPDITRSSGAWTAQAILKVTAGGLVGLLGCWVLQSGVLDATQPVRANQLAVWAVLFGFSQDAVTKRFDVRLGATAATTTTPPTPTTADEDDPA